MRSADQLLQMQSALPGWVYYFIFYTLMNICSLFLKKCRVNIDSEEEFLKTGNLPILTVLSAGHALHVFINEELSGIIYTNIHHDRTHRSKIATMKGLNC